MKKIFLIQLLALFIMAGVVNAQTEDLPNAGLTPENPIYFFDKLGEALQEFFTFNPEAKAHLQIAFAAERIAEIKIVLETKGVEAKGLAVAETRLQEHLGDAADIVTKQKNKGEDVSMLAKELNDEFEKKKNALKQSFKEQERVIEAKEKELEKELKEARRTNDATRIETIIQELVQLETEEELLDIKEDELEDKLEEEEEKLEDEMDAREEAEEEIEEALEERQEVVDEATEEGVILPLGAFAQFDSLISQAQSAFNAENYQEAEQLAEQADDLLEDIEEIIEKLEEEMEDEENDEEEEEDNNKKNEED